MEIWELSGRAPAPGPLQPQVKKPLDVYAGPSAAQRRHLALPSRPGFGIAFDESRVAIRRRWPFEKEAAAR